MPRKTTPSKPSREPAPARATGKGKKPSAPKKPGKPAAPPPPRKSPPPERDAEAQWARPTKLDSALFQHPADASARRKLESLPGFQLLARKYLEFGCETLLHGLYMGSCIRLSPTQLPEIYNLLPPVCEAFGIAEPEFYLQMDPTPNAWTTGDKRIFVVVTSGLLEHMKDPAERQAVIAHECGHIVCRHILYRSMATLIARFGVAFFGILRPLAKPIEVALAYWARRSELSADRASAIFSGGADPMIRGLLRLTGGPSALTGKIDVPEFAAQARAYDELQKNSKWHKILQGYAIMEADHPLTAVRVRELLSWQDSREFAFARDAIRPGSAPLCPSCRLPHAPGQKFCRHCGVELPKT